MKLLSAKIEVVDGMEAMEKMRDILQKVKSLGQLSTSLIH